MFVNILSLYEKHQKKVADRFLIFQRTLKAFRCKTLTNTLKLKNTEGHIILSKETKIHITERILDIIIFYFYKSIHLLKKKQHKQSF